jgi:hypothetical protein
MQSKNRFGISCFSFEIGYRKNSRAKASAILFPILQTAKANGTIPKIYLSHVLVNINEKPLKELLPWSKEMPEYTKYDLSKYMETK